MARYSYFPRLHTKPINTGMFDSFLANDRAVYIIVHYKEALV